MPILATVSHPYFGLGAYSNPDLIAALAAAIRQQEGYYPGSRAYRNNNPGNLMDPSGTIFRYPKDPQGFVIFPDYATGEAALENDLSIKVGRGMSITSLLNMYAPAAAGNNTAQYIANVSAATGIDPTVPLNQIGAGSPVILAQTPGFDVSSAFPTDSDTSTLSFGGGVLPDQGASTGALAGLLLGGIILFFLFRD